LWAMLSGVTLEVSAVRGAWPSAPDRESQDEKLNAWLQL
jgi:hypothetical protein